MYLRPESFVFCEKRTGAIRFKVEAGMDGRVPVDEAASLLAMHCLIRRETPDDYMVMVKAGNILFDGVASRAEELLEAVQAVTPCPIDLTRRERQVLKEVFRGLANKEIGERLSISERTVKFHVSSLLAKFGVQRRADLNREAAAMLLPGDLSRAVSPVEFPLIRWAGPPSEPRAPAVKPSSRTGNRVVRLPGRTLYA